MTALRQSVMKELERVPEDKLYFLIQFINTLTTETKERNKNWNLEQFVMPPTERGQQADVYIRELRDRE